MCASIYKVSSISARNQANSLDFNEAPRQQVIDFNSYSPLSIVDANEWPLQDEELTRRNTIIPNAPATPRKGGDRG